MSKRKINGPIFDLPYISSAPPTPTALSILCPDVRCQEPQPAGDSGDATPRGDSGDATPSANASVSSVGTRRIDDQESKG